jgi:hypothetical protein
MNMGFDKKQFSDFTKKWLSKKRISKDYMYPISKLKTWLMTDFEKQRPKETPNPLTKRLDEKEDARPPDRYR